MKNNNKNNIFDEDFLWLFRKIEKPSICLSLDYHIIEITPAAVSLLMVSRKESIGKHLPSLFASLGLDIIFFDSGKSPVVKVVKVVNEGTHKAQKICNLDWKIKSKVGVDGKDVGFILYVEERTDIEYLSQVYKMVTGQDKIDQESVEDYAEDIKNYLEDIIGRLPGNVFWMDKNCVYLGCNDNVVKFLELDNRKEIAGMAYDDVERKAGWTAGHTDSWKKDDQEVIATGKPKLNVEEVPVLMPDGREVFYLTNRAPLFDKGKNVIGVLGVSIDITDRKLMERELQLTCERAEKAEKKLLSEVNKEITGEMVCGEKSPADYMKGVQNYLENIIGGLPGNIYWMDRNCVYLGCNDNAAKFAGLGSRRDAVGKTYEETEKIAGWTAGHTNSWKKDDQEVIATGKPKLNVEEKPVLMPNGEYIYYLTSRVPLFDDKGQVIGVAGVSIDITDRKRAERYQKEKEVAEKTSDHMKMLAGSIAHEMRTPLAIIGISSDLLMMNPAITKIEGEGKKEVDKRFGSIKHAIKLGSYIVDNILIMLKTLSSKETVRKHDFERLSIANDLNELLEMYPFLNQQKSLVKIEFGEIKDFSYNGNRILTQHVLFNLVKNALHAIKEVDKGEIEIILESDDSFNYLKFKDTAMGMSPEALQNLFSQFATTKRGVSAGLGLSFCKMVMNLYGGDINCKSKDGEYTEFSLSFPK